MTGGELGPGGELAIGFALAALAAAWLIRAFTIFQSDRADRPKTGRYRAAVDPRGLLLSILVCGFGTVMAIHGVAGLI